MKGLENMIKPSTFFVLIISLFSAVTIVPMDPPKKDPTEKKQSKKRGIVVRKLHAATTWVEATGHRILHGLTPGTHLQEELTIPNDPFPFGKLPQDVQRQIIFYLATYGSAQSLIEACQMVSALAQTNKLLNALIDTPSFCLQLITKLSKKFNCDNMTVCTTLQTMQAKKQAFIQQDLYNLCFDNDLSDDTRGMQLITLKNAGAYLDFTYAATQSTILIIACYIRPAFVKQLLDAGANPLVTNAEDESPLTVAEDEKNEDLIKMLKKYQKQ
jgi:hypothetical protein